LLEHLLVSFGLCEQLLQLPDTVLHEGTRHD
jgi:hypothetical protein